MEELTQTKLQQSRQLAEARQQLYTQERTGGEGGRGKVGRLEEELRTAQCELEKAREREKQVKVQVLKKKFMGNIQNQILLLQCCQNMYTYSLHM